MSEHIHKGHLHFVKEEAGKAVPCCSPRELELESERDQLREEVKIKEVIVAAQKACIQELRAELGSGDKYVKEQYKAYDEQLASWKSVAGKLKEALKGIHKYAQHEKDCSLYPCDCFVMDAGIRANEALALYNASRGEEGKK